MFDVALASSAFPVTSVISSVAADAAGDAVAAINFVDVCFEYGHASLISGEFRAVLAHISTVE